MQSEKEKSTEIPGWTYTYATTDDGRRFRLVQGPCEHFPRVEYLDAPHLMPSHPLSMTHSHGLFGK